MGEHELEGTRSWAAAQADNAKVEIAVQRAMLEILPPELRWFPIGFGSDLDIQGIDGFVKNAVCQPRCSRPSS